MNSNSITHDGVIEDISDQKLFIRLTRLPACEGCHAKGICSVPEGNHGEVMITDAAPGVRRGDRVTVSISQSLGFRALLIAYIVPFLLVLLVLVLLTAVHAREWVTGIVAMAILAPYFILIRSKKERIERAFRFEVRKKHKR